MLWVLPSAAQNYVDIVKLHYAQGAPTNFKNSNHNTTVKEFNVDLLYPIPLKKGNTLLTGILAEGVSARLTFLSSTITSVYSLNPKLGINVKHSPKWSGTYVLLPKISSDFKVIGMEDWQIGGLALLKYTQNKNLNYKFGAYYNSEQFGPFIVPLLGLYYLSKDKRLELNLTLPMLADVNFALKQKVKVGVNFLGLIRSYHLNEGFASASDVYLAKTTNELFGYLQFDLSKSLLVQTKMGYSIGRSFYIYDDSDRISWGLSAIKFGDKRKELNSKFEDGMVFRVRLIYRHHLEDKS